MKKEFIRIHTIREVHTILGIERPKHPLVSVLPIDERMTSFEYGENSYSFDFYQISLKIGLNGSWVYGRNTYDFEEGTMTFLKPNQVIKIDNRKKSNESAGWTLLFHPALIRKYDLGSTIDSYSFFHYDTYEALHLSNSEKQLLIELFQKIRKEYEQNIDKHSQDLIVANLEMILKYCTRYYDRQFLTRTRLNKDLITKFERLLSAYFQSELPREKGVLSVQYCANVLNMSPNYLGDLIKNETGKSAKEHIQDYLIEQAKIQLLNSQKTISEIAYSLGFEYPQNFNRLFKARTEISPTQYREKHV